MDDMLRLNSARRLLVKLLPSLAPMVLLCLSGPHVIQSGASQRDPQVSKAVPLQVDYGPPPKSWGEALDRADVAAVIELKESAYERDPSTGTAQTRFRADVVELIRQSRSSPVFDAVTIVRYGGVEDLAGEIRLIEERHFPPWKLGQTLLVFLTWSDRLKAYTLPFGPDAAFELNPDTKKVRVFASTTFAARHHGRDAAALLTEVKEAAEKRDEARP